MNTEIVTLTPDDWQAYRQLRLESLRTDPEAFGSSYETMAERPESYWRGRLEQAAGGQNGWLLFLKEESKVIGMIGAFQVEEPAADNQLAADDQPAADNQPGEKAEPVGEIISVYLSPPARGRSLSRLLMAAILDLLKQNGISKAVLSVAADQAAAIALYKRFGFEITGEHVTMMGDGQMHPGYTMELRVIK